jgi:hypothetical protein
MALRCSKFPENTGRKQAGLALRCSRNALVLLLYTINKQSGFLPQREVGAARALRLIH